MLHNILIYVVDRKIFTNFPTSKKNSTSLPEKFL